MSSATMVRLRDLGEWKGGNTPSKENAAYWTNGTVPWVSPKDMKVNEITSSEDRITEAALNDGRVSMVETKNRIVLILLDSNFEIALKEFVVHRPDLFPQAQFNIQQLFERRYKVIDAVSQKVSISKGLLDKAKHYYELRNKLVHERATASITDTDIENYRETIEQVLATLFGLRF